MAADSRADQRAETVAPRVPGPAAEGDRRRPRAALPAVLAGLAGLILAGAMLGPLVGVDGARPVGPSAMADATGRAYPPIRSRTIVSTGLGIRTLYVVVAISWRGHVPEEQSARLVLRRIPRSAAVDQRSREVRSVTVPVAGMDSIGGETSFRVGVDVSALPRGAYGILVLLPSPAGGAWAPGTSGIDERVIDTYVAPYPTPSAVCCLVW